MSVVVASLPDGGVGGHAVLTKGAPEAVLARCTSIADEDGPGPLTAETRRRLDARLQDLAEQGLRLMACAARRVDRAPADRDDAERDLTLLGFVALSDPVRDAVPDAVRLAHAAGITVHVITGDNGATAAAIARSAGIGSAPWPHVVSGPELDEMTDEALDSQLAGPTRSSSRAAHPRTSCASRPGSRWPGTWWR